MAPMLGWEMALESVLYPVLAGNAIPPPGFAGTVSLHASAGASLRSPGQQALALALTQAQAQTLALALTLTL